MPVAHIVQSETIPLSAKRRLVCVRTGALVSLPSLAVDPACLAGASPASIHRLQTNHRPAGLTEQALQ